MLDHLSQIPLFAGVAKLLSEGGPVVGILLVLAVFAGTVILVKLLQLSAISLVGKGAVKKAVEEWISGDRAAAYNRIDNRSAPTAQVLAHLMRGLQRGSKREDLIREDVERVAIAEMSNIRSWFKAIEAVAQIAPLLGLFGTVIGMIEAFQNLQSSGADA